MATTVIKEGYLQKESLYLNTPRQRWMVLKGHTLYSYKKMQTYDKPTEIIDLLNFDAVLITKTGEFGRFELTSSKTNSKRTFVSSSIQILNEWLAHIIKIIKQYYRIKPIQSRPHYDFPMEDDSVVFSMCLCYAVCLISTMHSYIKIENTLNNLGELGLV
eukprot:481877_1